MRHFLFGLSLLATLPALAGPPATTVTISGQILHPKDQDVAVYTTNSKAGETKLDVQGRFTLSFEWKAEGPANLETSEEMTRLWLKPGDKLTVTIDANQFDESVKYGGAAAPLNAYLAREYMAFEKANEQKREVLARPLPQATKWLDSVHTLQRAFLTKAFPKPATAQDKAFRAWRLADIDYSWATARLDLASKYGAEHPTELRPTDAYFDFLRDPALKLDNEAAANAEDYSAFQWRYLSYQAARKNGTFATPVTDLALYRQVGLLMPAAKQAEMQFGLVMDALSQGEASADSLYVMARADKRFSEKQQQQIGKTWEVYQKIPKAGQPAPDISFQTEDGKQMKLSDLRGKLVFLDFWASWCGPCIGEMPAARKLHVALHDKPNLVFLNVSIDGKEENWHKGITKHGVDGLNVWSGGDWKSPAIEAYGVRGIPRYFLISPDGIILDNNAPRPSGGARAAIETALVR